MGAPCVPAHDGGEKESFNMAQPAQNVFHALDQALAAAVAVAGPSMVHVARGHGHAGTRIVWADAAYS
jgi:hypothetical protein